MVEMENKWEAKAEGTTGVNMQRHGTSRVCVCGGAVYEVSTKLKHKQERQEESGAGSEKSASPDQEDT